MGDLLAEGGGVCDGSVAVADGVESGMQEVHAGLMICMVGDLDEWRELTVPGAKRGVVSMDKGQFTWATL